MKKIMNYKGLTEELIGRLNSESFKFLKFHEGMGDVELVTVEENDKILAYAILEHANDMNQDYYEDLIYKVEEEKAYVLGKLMDKKQCSQDTLLVVDKSLNMINKKDFYYISYAEAIPSREGNGSLMVEFIKKNYPETVLVSSGYDLNSNSKDFWIKKGYEDAGFLMING